MMLSLQVTTLIIFLHLVSSYDFPLCEISFKLINSNVRSLMSPSNTLLNFQIFFNRKIRISRFAAETLIRAEVRRRMEQEKVVEEDTV